MLADNCAKLRSDLEVRTESPDPRSPVVVKDPITNGFYRFTWIQATVLSLMDGRADPETVAATASAQCQTSVESGQVEDFIGKLQGLALLDTPMTWAGLEKLGRRRHRLVDSLLSIKLHAVNPDRMLGRMDKRFGGFFFGAGFHVLAWVSIAAALILSIVNWDQLYLSVPTLFTLYSVPLIVVVAFAVMTVHELAHGLTLKHFGGKVEEMGLLVLYFIPAFYCNVSDAWLLRKRERVCVSFAGGFMQLVLWAWATILWRLLSPETIGSQMCLIAIAFSGIMTLFNFNPLIRLDGYYLLSDYIETPNLRQKAFGYLKRKLSGWLTGAGTGRASFSRREKRIFVLYGLSSFAFSAGLLLIVLGRIGSWMIGEYRTWGIVMFSVLCLMVVPVTSKENIAATGRLAGGVGARVRKMPSLLVLLAIVVAGGFLPWELKVTGDFMILPSSKVTINPEVEGTLKSILVEEGDLVKKGDVLAEVQNLELSNDYEETRGELAAARATLSLLLAGTRPEEIERARSVVSTRKTDLENAGRVEQERKMLQETVSKKQAELQNAQAVFDRSKKLFSEGLIARNEFELNQTAFNVKQKELSEALGQLKVLEEKTDRDTQLKSKELAQAQSELKIALAGSRKESIQAVEAGVLKLEERLSILGQQLEQMKIRSTIDGLVATPYMKNRLGEFLNKGSVLCEIVDVRVVNVDMPVPEKEVGDVAVGFPIVVKVRTFPKRDFPVALVKAISPVAVDGGQVSRVMIRGELDNADGMLKPGMTGVGKIICGQRMIGELVTRRIVRWLRTEFWEYLP